MAKLYLDDAIVLLKAERKLIDDRIELMSELYNGKDVRATGSETQAEAIARKLAAIKNSNNDYDDLVNEKKPDS